MDARVDVWGALGLAIGDTHVIRNAGGVLTEDVVRSLVISQRLLDTRSIVILMHTDRGMISFTDEALKDRIEEEVGECPAFSFAPFDDLAEEVRRSLKGLMANRFIPHRDDVRRYIYDVHTGELQEVRS
jgi:carbonic anhydrase